MFGELILNYYKTILPEYRQYVFNYFDSSEEGKEDLQSFLLNISESYFSECADISFKNFVVENIIITKDSVITVMLISYQSAVFSFSFDTI